MASCPNCHRQGQRCSFSKEQKPTKAPIPRKRGLKTMLKEIRNLYNVERKVQKSKRRLTDIVSKKRNLAKAIMEAEKRAYI
jgi:ribosomal protein S15P/S13E